MSGAVLFPSPIGVLSILSASAFNMEKAEFLGFPSPTGVLSILSQLMKCLKSWDMSFRPLLGFYLYYQDWRKQQKLKKEFPSPIGVLSILLVKLNNNEFTAQFPSPIGVLSILS